jgi:glutamine synthetase type III
MIVSGYWWLTHVGSWWSLPALVIYGFSIAAMFAPVHECVHRTAFASNRANDVVAWLAGLLSFYNSTFYRRYHKWHHRYTRIVGRDPELSDPMPQNLAEYLWQVSGIPWWIGKLQGHWGCEIGQFADCPYIPETARAEVQRSVQLQLAVYGLAIAADGAGFAGFAAWLDMTPYRVKTGVECEYFLLNGADDQLSDGRDRANKPCYDQQALMRRFDVIAEICDGMLGLGWEPYQNDHEDANGQFEMNWKYADALVTADRHAFFKYMVKSIAEKHGYRATFMPKPFAKLTGNGCHTHLSAWDIAGDNNLFDDQQGNLGLSKLAYQFIGGVLHSASAICAYSNPTVNSYKRLNAAMTTSGATWSPTTVSYGGNNRTHTIRIPDRGRFEFRLPDGAANPYLLPAALIAAGLEGVAAKRNPGARSDMNSYTESIAQDVPKLPQNLLDALRNLEDSQVLIDLLGQESVSSYIKLKKQEWSEYSAHLSSWEMQHTLDC